MWKNFKNLAGWESRYYFVSEELKFHTHKGRNDINDEETEESVIKEAYKLLEFVKKNIKFSKKKLIPKFNKYAVKYFSVK